MQIGLLNDLKALEAAIQNGLDLNQCYNGLTLLDFALIYDQQAAVALLLKHGSAVQLTADQIVDHRNLITRQSPLMHHYHIKFLEDLEINDYHPTEGRLLNKIIFSREELDEVGLMRSNMGVISLDRQPYFAILDKQNSTLPIAIFRIINNELEIHRINSTSAKIRIDSDYAIAINESISVKALEINSTRLTSLKEAKIQAQTIGLSISGEVSHNGVLISEKISLKAQHTVNNGQIIATGMFRIENKGCFDQKGMLVAARQGQVKAHVIENHDHSIIQVYDGELKLYGRTAIRNSGSLLSDYLVLDSEGLINNYYGALIKAVTCIVPPKLTQFNNAGFYLVGRKNHLTAFDKALNYASAVTEIANIFAFGSASLQNLRTGLMVGKALYQGASILSKLYQGGSAEVLSGELVHLFLDHVMPSVGTLSGNEQKTRFICNVLYQFWGWYLGEDAFIQNSLSLIEMLVQGGATFGTGYLNQEEITLLEKVANTIRYSRQTLKLANVTAGVMNGFLSNNQVKWDNTKESAAAFSESILRDLLQNLQLEKIFNVNFHPKDLALFVLNKGNQQSYGDGLRRAIFSLVYALHKSDVISDDIKADYQFYAQAFFSNALWPQLLKKFRTGELTYSTLIQQAFNQVTLCASHKASSAVEYVKAMFEVQKALDSDYATQGYLGIFAETLHNEGILDTVGNDQILVSAGTNNNLIRATKNIDVRGKDDVSYLNNQEEGTLKAHQIYSLRINVDNYGAIQGEDEINDREGETFINHQGSWMASQGEVHLQSKKKVAHNGHLISKTVSFEAPQIEKKGGIQAFFCATRGFDRDIPDAITWRTSAADNIYGLRLNPSTKFEYDPDAFNKVKTTDLQLNYPYSLGGLNIDPAFENTLQVSLPSSGRVLSVESLPRLNPKATFSLIAPGSTLNTKHVSGKPFEYESTLRFSGYGFQYEGKSTFRKGFFDTNIFEGAQSDSALYLKEGGLIQAKQFSNVGHVHADGIVDWNVEHFTNNAQTKENIQQFTHSKQTNVLDTHYGSVIIENSGTVHAKGHRGYIGELNQQGGRFTSGKEGNYVHVNNANLRPLFSEGSQYTLNGTYEDKGKSWHELPISHNSKIGSEGENILLGTGKLKASGVDLWGDQGNHTHFDKGIETLTEERTYQVEETRSRERGKDKVTTFAYQGSVKSKNRISSNQDDISLVAREGSIDLKNVLISTPHNAFLNAKETISISGVELNRSEFVTHRHRGWLPGLFHSKKTISEKQIIDIESSYLLIGENMVVSCLDFNLTAVQGVVGGDIDVKAKTMTLDGKRSHYADHTRTTAFSIGLPIDNLVTLLSGHNAKAIFSTLIQNMGWEPQELEALLNAKNIAEIPLPLLNLAKNTWDLTALVAHAFNEYSSGTPDERIGKMTDQLGLTRMTEEGKRTINPMLRLNASKVQADIYQSKMIASNLYVGGTFKLDGNKLTIADGSKIDAEHLLIALKEGIEMIHGVDVLSQRVKLKEGGGSINIAHPKEFTLHGKRESAYVESEVRKLALLQGRSSADIDGGKIQGEGQIIAPAGTIKAGEINLSSVQNIYKEGARSKRGAIDTTALSLSAHLDYSAKEKITTETAGVFIPGGIVKTRYAHLEKGSLIHAKEFVRLNDEKRLPTVTGNVAYDCNRSHASAVGLEANPSLPGAKLNYSNEMQKTSHRPSVYADNIREGDLPGINSTKSREVEKQEPERVAFSLPAVLPNLEKLKEQKEEIKGAGRALYFMFKPSQKTSLSSPDLPQPAYLHDKTSAPMGRSQHG